MSCYLEKQAGKLNAVLIFKRDQLLYDIKNAAFIEGRVMEGDADMGRRRAIVQDVGEAGNVDRVTRMLDLAMARCREMLYPYTKHAVVRGELDNRLREREVFGVVMSVPEDFSQTSLVLLKELIHEYLVCKALGDWLGMTYPEKAQMWEAKAESAAQEIRTNLNARIGRVRRRMHPF